MNNIEIELLKAVREASSEDCKRLIDYLSGIEKDNRDIFIDASGEYTDIGLLMGAIKEELMINGVVKTQFNE